MKSNLVHKSKRFFQKLGLKIHKNFKGKGLEPTTGERESTAIVNRLTKDPDSELLTCPNSGKYYIKCNKKHMLIVIGYREINIINHVYSYTVHLTDKTESNIRNLFLDEVEKRRDLMEQEFRSSVTHSLKTIYNSLNNEK
jgi:hypothetical protein